MNEKQKEILVITQEECAEVIQEISKIFRFGIDDPHRLGITHREKLETEIGDLLTMIDLLICNDVITAQGLENAKRFKVEKLKRWSKIYE
jgi:NTP pyrophosphatase (non-canonical NTP hydrolase)